MLRKCSSVWNTIFCDAGEENKSYNYFFYSSPVGWLQSRKAKMSYVTATTEKTGSHSWLVSPMWLHGNGQQWVLSDKDPVTCELDVTKTDFSEQNFIIYLFYNFIFYFNNFIIFYFISEQIQIKIKFLNMKWSLLLSFVKGSTKAFIH